MKERLNRLLSLVGDGDGIIDVGTDHGYIPVELALNGYRGNIIASDINEMPLSAAINASKHANIEGKIDFRLGDGLECCSQDEVDHILIAGMGGDLICKILDTAEWCMSEKYTLILQPMTKPEILRYWLINNGFHIEHEEFVRENKLHYQIIVAKYTGINETMSDAELYCGLRSHIIDYDYFFDYVSDHINRFKKIAKGITHSSNNELINFYSDLINQFSEMLYDK